jgi:DNA-binding NarL/FixJ family response regulator
MVRRSRPRRGSTGRQSRAQQAACPQLRVAVRVALVDDHPIVLLGLAAALATMPEVRVVGTASSLETARHLLKVTQPEVVLLSLQLPDGSGAVLLEEAVRHEHRPAFVILSTFVTEQYMKAAITLGARGFVLENAPTNQIAQTVLRVAGGATAFTPAQLRASQVEPWTPLPKRDHDIIEGVTAGLSNDELSAKLTVSRKTVEAHLSRLFGRFEVAGRTELAVRVEREHALDLPTAEAIGLLRRPACSASGRSRAESRTRTPARRSSRR